MRIVTPAPSAALNFTYGMNLLTFLSRWGAENLEPAQSEALNQGLEELSRVLISGQTHMTESALHLDLARKYTRRWAHSGGHAHFSATSSGKDPHPEGPEYIDIDPNDGVMLLSGGPNQ